MTSFSIIIASHGNERWRILAQTRAAPSALEQGCQVIVHHEPEGSVASARNNGAAQADGEWLVFLDADDELTPGYVDALKQQINGDDLLITPAVIFQRGRRQQAPMIFPVVDMRDGNWLTIGTALPKALFESVGGFTDGIDLYEDWHLWARCVRDGGTPVACPDAVYVAHVASHSRNRHAHLRGRLYWHQWIGHDVFPESYEATTPIEDGVKRLSTRHLRRL